MTLMHQGPRVLPTPGALPAASPRTSLAASLDALPPTAPVLFAHDLVGHPLVGFDAMAEPFSCRALIDEVVTGLALGAHRAPATLTQRHGKLVHSATHTTSVARFAVDHTVVFQIEGRSTVHHGHVIDASYHDQAERGYWGSAGGELRVRPPQTGAHGLEPGEAVCLPAFTPYWSSVGADGSMTLVISFQTSDRSYAAVEGLGLGPLTRLRAVAR